MGVEDAGHELLEACQAVGPAHKETQQRQDDALPRHVGDAPFVALRAVVAPR